MMYRNTESVFIVLPLPNTTKHNKTFQIDAISIEELDLLYKIPNSVPISSQMWLNIDELIEVRFPTFML